MEKNSAPNKTVHLLYKNLGETPNEAILRFKKDNPEYEGQSMTYAGRLDPMAEGLLLVLSGEELTKKDEYLNLQKTYEFEMLWGFETDTLDLLGVENSYSTNPPQGTDIFLLENSSSSLRRVSLGPSQDIVSTNFPTNSQISDYVGGVVGKIEQKYPVYSSKPVQGKPLFQWAREGKLGSVEIPSHEVEICSGEFLSRRNISGKELLDVIAHRISLVKGDFRQNEILNRWKGVLEGREKENFMVDKMSLTVSSGFYVRQFVEDLAKSFNAKAVTFSIKRTKVGEFEKVDN
jgi:tRNA U55 pseudouridine synthase TruB